ncbi:MAG: hypothetical protein QXX29_04795 [Nitrososphaerota archaeon]
MGGVVEGVRLVNLTLHEITIYTDRGAVFIHPSGLVARIGDIPINHVEYGEVEEEGFEDAGQGGR